MVDYSKWKDIEISDDEDETHPNIDTPSLFRWRHQARVERMETFQKEKEAIDKKAKNHREKLSKKQVEISEAEKGGVDVTSLKIELQSLEKEMDKITEEQEEFKKKEKTMPWNVDTISQQKFSKTVINKQEKGKTQEELTDEEKEKRLREFSQKYEKEIKHYGMLRKFEDSKKYMMEHPYLACDETANYLVFWSINLEMEEKHELMAHVAHQVICVQYILELAKQLNLDPRACIVSFFSKIQVADEAYKQAFQDEVEAFIGRIQKRSKEKLEKLMEEAEEEERQKRLGPGGLDPVEVFESLPEALKECFEKQDIPLLQQIIAKMEPTEAKYHMKRCVDSGLWVPEANKEEQATSNEPSFISS
ncbi:hsp90 co-chaperone Cdc37-like [Artemia franciscana]|uniref:Hsp90 co-chaperone Cdc37 n=1 Tax=Artemia franciscana TaxID=6661 RepID=A0AA88LDU8_ARTSF|nr:hypothetical protein QYM36_006669 [Artemia franciscana]